jgi:hypothetical protein
MDEKTFVEQQWQEWQDKNPASSFKDIDVDYLREKVKRELTYVSQMDVKEYTLYQKWCEVQDKYPSREVSTLFGVEKQLIDLSQAASIGDVKSNIWVPESAEDYLNLKPVLEYTDDSGEITKTGIDGSSVTITKKRNQNYQKLGIQSVHSFLQ